VKVATHGPGRTHLHLVWKHYVLPEGLQHFVDGVVPILRQPGIFRTDYDGSTLREHFGLSRPTNAHALRQDNTVTAGREGFP